MKRNYTDNNAMTRTQCKEDNSKCKFEENGKESFQHFS